MDKEEHSQVFDLGSDAEDPEVEDIEDFAEGDLFDLNDKEEQLLCTLWVRKLIASEVQKELKRLGYAKQTEKRKFLSSPVSKKGGFSKKKKY